MAAPKSEWRKAGDRILAEGPTDRGLLTAVMASHVPPNLASAATMRNRRRCAKSATTEGDIYSPGAHHIADAALRMALRNGTWVKLPDGRVALRDDQIAAAPEVEA